MEHIGFNIFFLLVAVFLLIQGCCQSDEKIEDPCGQACLFDEKCDNGRCVCANGGIKMGDYCVEITDKHYYAKTNGCNCINEILVHMFRQNQTILGTYSANMNFSLGYSDNSDYGYYYKDFNGSGYDSIVLLDIIRPRCEINGKAYSALLAGRLMGQDSIDAWIKWYPSTDFPDPLPPMVDSCHFYLVRPKR